MKYEYPPLPATAWQLCTKSTAVSSFNILAKPAWDEYQVKEYAEQAVAPLLAEIERLETAVEEAIASLDCGMVLGAKDTLNEVIFKHDRA